MGCNCLTTGCNYLSISLSKTRFVFKTGFNLKRINIGTSVKLVLCQLARNDFMGMSTAVVHAFPSCHPACHDVSNENMNGKAIIWSRMQIGLLADPGLRSGWPLGWDLMAPFARMGCLRGTHWNIYDWVQGNQFLIEMFNNDERVRWQIMTNVYLYEWTANVRLCVKKKIHALQVIYIIGYSKTGNIYVFNDTLCGALC